jgi:hypothetical protein
MKAKARFGGTLEEVEEQLQSWRQEQGKRVRLPERLWEMAVKLSRAHGVSQVARTLGLDYYTLKERASLGSAAVVAPKPASFVEVEVGQQVSGPECRIELENGKGLKMSLELRAPSPEEVVALAQGLWRNR